MSVIITKENTSFSASNNFYRVEAYQLGGWNSTSLNTSTERIIPVTFANAGNCMGIVLLLYYSSTTTPAPTRGLTVKLQEDVAGTWTDRASKYLAPGEICGSSDMRGNFYTPFEFETPYAVDTAASKWRFVTVRDTGSGDWSLRTCDATNPMYATWCDNVVSFTTNDIIIVKNTLSIDTDVELGAETTAGVTTIGISGIVCRNIDTSVDNVALLKWEDTPATSHKFTLHGVLMMGTNSGFRVGTAATPIPVSAQAIFDMGSIGAGTTHPGFRGPSSSVTYDSGRSNIFMYGEYPTLAVATLASDTNTGTNTIVTEEETGWQAGDTIAIGKSDTTGQGDLTVYTIDSVSGTTITLTSNLGTYNRKAGAKIIRTNGYGVVWQEVGTSSADTLYNMSNLYLKGVLVLNKNIATAGTTQYYPSDDDGDRLGWTVEDCALIADRTGPYYFLSSHVIPIKGTTFTRVNSFRMIPFQNLYAYYRSDYKSGRVTLQDSVVIGQYSGIVGSPGTYNYQLTVENCYFQNGRTSSSFVYLNGLKTIFKNNEIWGMGYTLGALQIGQLIQPIDISGNKYDRCVLAQNFMSLPTVDVIEENAQFGQQSANTTDIAFSAGALIDYTYISPVGITTVDESQLPETVAGSHVRIVSFDTSPGDDRGILTYGKFQKTGTGLTDTTCRTNPGYALRFESTGSANSLSWGQDIPTGNIQNKTMVVTCFVKINTTGFYAVDHTNPTLRVVYDGGEESSAIATDGTDWQRLTVTITPTTTSGKITVYIEGATDATGSDAYFYLDDMSILYPAGVQLNLGGLDEWDNAMPVTPVIATNITAADVWAVDKSIFTSSNTMGGHLSKSMRVSDFIGLK